jgi:hypothetical protein
LLDRVDERLKGRDDSLEMVGAAIRAGQDHDVVSLDADNDEPG